jgi:hypothetical protein
VHLATASFEANRLMESHAPLLKAALGPQGAELQQWVDSFLYDEALETLKQARRDWPELAAQ